METLKTIFTDTLSDYKVVDIVLKVWLAVLLVMFVLGMGTLIFHLIQNTSAMDNATFGIFDTLG
jgi:flagellar basal body-associated protein FliL